MSIKLYELGNSFEELWRMIDILEADDENYNDYCEAILTTLEGLEKDFEDKAENIAVYIKRLTAESTAIADEAKKLASRKKSMESSIEFLKGYLFSNMLKLSLSKIDKPRASISLRNNAESVQIEDVNAVLGFKQYIKPQKLDESAIDKTALKAALQAGEVVSGASLVRKQSLQIK